MPKVTLKLAMTLPNLSDPSDKNLKVVTTQMKALDEYILMVLFVLLLKTVHFLVNET